LINNPREVSRHIRERFEARNVGPKTTRQLNHPPSQKPKVEKPRGAKVVKRDRSPSPENDESDAYAPDPALAKALSALSPKDTDAKREVLERHGFSCTKKGDRWTYQRGSGRAVRCLATLQAELAAPPAKKKRIEEPDAVVVEGSIRDIASSVDLGALPARCRVQAPEASKYRACSVLAQERGLASSVGGWHRHLVLYDDKLSLQWVESTGSRPCKWRRGDSTKSEREREADVARKLGPKACDDMMAWLCSLDVSDPLLHADPLVRNLLPKKCERLRDYGVTLRRVKERLAERDYDDAFEFSEDIRRVHETILSICSSKLPRSWDEDAPLSKNGDRETILHAAQVFRSAFESRWSSLLKRISAESLSEKRATAAWRQKPKRGSSNANYDKGAGAVGKVVEVYWEGEGEWFRGRLTRYRDADGKHRCDYEDGESEWLTLAENSVRFPDNDVVLSPTQQTRKVCEPINGFSCQKLGVLVWAKTGKYPWWPAETCLLAVDELTKHFPPNPLGQQRGDAKETTMVLYFGDVQMDAVDADHVAPYSIADPREREVPAPGLGPAVDHCHKRAEELEIATDDVADP